MTNGGVDVQGVRKLLGGGRCLRPRERGWGPQETPQTPWGRYILEPIKALRTLASGWILPARISKEVTHPLGDL